MSSDKPNPEWVSAPYEEKGICDLDTFKGYVEWATRRFKEFTITSARSGNMIAYHLKENWKQDETRLP